ncbi:MAG TPA: hypothetical protein VGN83_11530 [Falsiroseomonas sp.]|jgi:hypothetical protein|nr:hypothetical protein [Falsiroseomonas sp.]
MAQDEKGRRGGTSRGERSPTARPSSVGPHHRDRAQEDPGNPGIRPEEGYGAEIARNNEAAAGQPSGKAAVVAPTPKTGRNPEGPDAAEQTEDPGKAPPVAPTPPQAETADESGGTEEMLRQSGAPCATPPLTGTAKE